VRTAIEALGGLDAAVCNAGFAKRQPFLDITLADWDRAQAVNLRGVFLVSQAAARHMVNTGGGAIVHVSSSTVHRPTLNTADYTAAKAGVEALTRSMAVELGKHGIRVNAVAPGLTATDMNREALKDPAFTSSRLERIPLRRIGEPEDIAGAVIFLLSDDARYVTGATVRVDAGLSIG
jgi:NAD(P)-dependent dehydrogenase (short-subunit alcohol dehydrogenase family)